MTEQVGPKRHLSVQATRLIHEHIGTIMSFAYSQQPLREMMKSWYEGEFKYLRRALFEIPEPRAERALIELGLYIRAIDEAENLSTNNTLCKRWEFGELVYTDGSRVPLVLREVANKIIHADRYAWSVPAIADNNPTATCFPNKSQREKFKWSEDSIDLIALAGFCGSLMS